MLLIFPCITRCFHLLHVGSCRSIWKTLRTSLQVSILHPRYHSSSTGTLLPFIIGFFFITRRFFINDVTQQCYITALCLRSLLWNYCHITLHLGFFLELLSLVLQKKSHPSFLVGDCMWYFLQVKCTSCMIRNIS